MMPRNTDGGVDTSSLEVSNVLVNFQGLRAINDVSLEVRPGEVLGLIGPNGAGKTTLVNVMTGYQKADRGAVRLDGADIAAKQPFERSRLGVVRTFQSVLPFSGLTVLENVEAGAMAQGFSRRDARLYAMDVLQSMGLEDRASRRVETLPFGEERRVGIARAIAMKPRYLLMDEPGAGLNDAECEELELTIARIKTELQCGILLIEHRMSLIFGIADRIHVLQNGTTIATGSPADIQADSKVRQAYLGDEMI